MIASARIPRFFRIIFLLIAVWCCSLWAANVDILDQDLNVNGQGYTVLSVWGTYYEMGYAHTSVLGDFIIEAIDQAKAKLGGNYAAARNLVASSVWLPLESEDELDGMVDCLNVTHPAAAVDKLDLKVLNTVGDWLYACRSHTCWGRYVAAPVKTLSTRRLDFSTVMPFFNHHVLIAYNPNDASAKWLNMAWPGFVTVVQGINEYGTLVSLHDFQSSPADLTSERMSRLVAARYAITYITSDDISTQLEHVFTELQNYEIMTGGFINYYAPLGLGGVINCSPQVRGPDFYLLRTPQAVWHHGEAMVTTNRDTDGTYTPSDEDIGVDAYYNNETPKTHESHWHLVDPVTVNQALSRLSVAYRGRQDMTVWADGRLDGIGRTPRLEYEWSDLFDTNIKYSGGTGEPNNPYQIATAEDLITLGEEPNDYDKYFILIDDVNLADYIFDRAVIAPDMNDAQDIWGDFIFDGSPFRGTFDGNGYTISHLTIRGGSYLGLFGSLGSFDSEAIVSNLGLKAVDVNGVGYFIGGLVGYNYFGSIAQCYSTGTVCGNEEVGGLVGENISIEIGKNIIGINTSYSTCTVSGVWAVGGLVGKNGYYSCDNAAGGAILNSYSTGIVTGQDLVGGLVGYNHEGTITSCYSTGTVNGASDVGGLVGRASYCGGFGGPCVPSSCTSVSFWDIETSGQSTSDAGEGKTTAEMQMQSTFTDDGWDFVGETANGPNDIWKMWDGYDYPHLTCEPGPNTPLVFVDINDPNFYGQMSRYEVTNDQYCDFLNAALASGDITINDTIVEGADGLNSGEDYIGQSYYKLDGLGWTGAGATSGSASRIHYNEGQFSVDDGFGNHPVTYISWYGAMAFANYYGYYLPTEDQWRAVADYDGTYIYGCGETIDPGIANYRDSENPDGTTSVGSYGQYGYGMSDMAGNVWEWTSSVLESSRIFCGGSWSSRESDCAISIIADGVPYANYYDIGFRVCR